MKKIAIVFAIVGLLFGVACAAESEKEVTIIAKPQVPEQTIKIELEVPDIKIDIPPVKIEPATSQVDVGTVITQVEGYYNNALNRIFNTITLWFAFIGVGVTVVLWYLGKREKKRQTDFNMITAEHRDTQKVVGIQISKHVILEGRVEKEISDLEDHKVRLEEQEKALDETNDFMVDALIKTFSNIGALHIENAKYAFAVENGMMAIRLYAYNPKKDFESGIDAMLSGIIGWLAMSDTKDEIIKLLKEKEELMMADYAKMKENKASPLIIEKYEKVMSKAGIDCKG